MTHRCVLLASALLLSVFSSSHSQDADKKKELERRYSELLGKAAALHVDLARWLEKEGQLAWAKYQYEWALEVVPGQADATAALAKEGVKWENKHQRFEQLDKSLVKGTVSSITPRPNWDKDPTIDYEVKFQSNADKPVYFTYAIRKKSNGYTWGSHSIADIAAKSPGGRSGAWIEEYDSETVKEFKGLDPKDAEVLITSVFRESASYSRLGGELLKRYKIQGSAIGVGFSNLGKEADGTAASDLATKSYRKAIVYDRDNANARQALGFTRVSFDFALAWNEDKKGHVTGQPRWCSKEEYDIRKKFVDVAEKEDSGEKCEIEGKPARKNKHQTVYPVTPVTIEDVEQLNRLVNAWIRLFNEWAGEGKDMFNSKSRGTSAFEIRKDPDCASVDLLKKEEVAGFLDSVIFSGFQTRFGFKGKTLRGNWVRWGVSLVFSKLLIGYSYEPNYDVGTSNSGKLPREKELRNIVNWQDSVRDSVISGTTLNPDAVLGIPVNTLNLHGELQLWSSFHYLITRRSEDFWAFVRLFAQDQSNSSGIKYFAELVGKPPEFIIRWRQFVLESY